MSPDSRALEKAATSVLVLAAFSRMSTQTAVDPSDDCTIWYVGDYVKKAAASYSTRIGALRLPGCQGAPAR